MKFRIPARLRLLSILQVNGLQSHFTAQKQKKMISEEYVCKNCDTHFVGNFCPVCGQSRKIRRLTFFNMLDDLVSLLINLDGGFLRSTTELFWRPGHMIRDYIQGKRKGYMKPLSLLFCLGTVYYLTMWLIAKDALPTMDGDQPGQLALNDKLASYGPLLTQFKELFGEIMKNPALMAFLFIMPMAPAASICFRRTFYGKVLNFMEHLHVLIFIGCQMLILTWFMALFHWCMRDHLEFMDFDVLYCGILLTWDYKQLFMISWKRSFKLVLLSTILAFFIAMTLIVTFSVIGYALVNRGII